MLLVVDAQSFALHPAASFLVLGFDSNVVCILNL